MTVKIGGKTYKGKYRGPDKFKGNAKMLAAWNAAKRRAGKKPTKTTNKAPAKPAVKAVPKPAAPAAKKVTAPNPGAVGSNSSGNISLQTNLDIENQVLEANHQLQQQEEQANQIQNSALIQQKLGLQNSQEEYTQQRGQNNAVMGMRGMRGSAAMTAKANDAESYRKALENVNTAKAGADEQARVMRTGAQGWRKQQQGQFDLARQQYTNERSRENPTTGSSPINSGLKPTKPAAIVKPKAAPVAKKLAPAKPKFKGKYPGPERFKGDKKKIAIWKASKRKVGKK